MRTVTDATLYVVKGPKGAYFAIRENETGVVITARTEREAMSLADQKDMVISDRLSATHDQLLAMSNAAQVPAAGSQQQSAMREGYPVG